jgi:hypothetical protein
MEIRNEKGELHNLDVPAYINGNYKEWWLNDKRHRDEPSDSLALAGEGGPAYITGNCKSWFINDIKKK